jgi:type VI secretion system secreted protein VgrG
MKVTKRAFAELAPMVVLTALFIAAPFHEALAQVAPPLGKTQSFAVLGGSSVTNTGSTVIIGDVGVSPGTVVGGFPPGTETGGTIHATDAVAGQAQIDNTAAYLNLAGQTPVTQSLTGTDLGGQTLVPGVYSFSSSA